MTTQFSQIARAARNVLLSLAVTFSTGAMADALPPFPNGKEADFIATDFTFKSGERMAELRLHYVTFGTPTRDATGHITNAILILHSTGGSIRQYFRPIFSDVLFSKGGLLDASRYYIIMPDSIGHGGSSKPSDGLHARFPKYDYDDMVKAQHLLVTKGLGVDHLRLILGASMGCMHAFVWGEEYPQMMDALMPLACLPVELAGRNRLWRKMVIDTIKSDPAYRDGEYTEQPALGLRAANTLSVIAGSAPVYMQKIWPTRADVDKAVDATIAGRINGADANDTIYWTDASRNYNPAPRLGEITAQVMWINSADDFINPPELGIAEREAARLKNGRFILLPISDETRGHGTHTIAKLWSGYLEALLAISAPPAH